MANKRPATRRGAGRRRAAPAAPTLDPGEQGSPLQLRQDAKLRRLGYRFSKEQADRVCDFFEYDLVHSKGRWAGSRFKLQPWQRAYLRRLFGWFRKDGTRRYRRTSCWIPRKNGKSTLAAGIALYLAFADNEQGAEVYCAASAAEQAQIVFTEAKRMALGSEKLAAAVEPFKDSLFMPRMMSRLAMLSAKASSKHGLNPHAVIIDEVHAIKDRELYDVLTSGSTAREQPMEVVISTAGFDRNSVGWEIWDYACKVRDGLIDDPEYLPLIYAADPTDDWHSPKTWKKANPNLGVAFSLAKFKVEYLKGRNSPGRENAFRRLHLNQWTEQATRWISMDKWDACNGPVDLRVLGPECWMGMDLSKRTDISAIVAVFKDGDDFACHPWFFLPEDEIEDRERRDGVPYRLWAKQGYLKLTPGNVIDYTYIRDRVLEVCRDFEVQELAYDPYGATQLAIQLQDDGVNCFEVGQGMKHMSEPTKALEALILSRRLRHAGNPVLRWMAANAAVIGDSSGNIKLAKNKSTARIDGLVALVMAIARGTLGEDQTSVYTQRGLATL